MKPKTKRLWIVLGCMTGLILALVLILSAFSGNLVYFRTPSQLMANTVKSGSTVRLGGMVVANSIHRTVENQTPVVTFDITDGQAAIKVLYKGILPDLFREGQSAIAIGSLNDQKLFVANEILAKHDETYMPKDVADALRKTGKWDPRFGPPPDPATWDHMTKPQ